MGILNVLFIVVILAAFAGVSMYMGRARTQKLEASNKIFLEKYPGAARVYPYSRSSITSEAVRIHSVDGQPPEYFYEAGQAGAVAAIIASVTASITGNGSNSGFYLKPGTSTVEMSYYHNRPGLMYKNVTTSTDAIKMDLAVEANKKYRLGFDRKGNTFTLDETT
jgi:hypothetical protein